MYPFKVLNKPWTKIVASKQTRENDIIVIKSKLPENFVAEQCFWYNNVIKLIPEFASERRATINQIKLFIKFVIYAFAAFIHCVINSPSFETLQLSPEDLLGKYVDSFSDHPLNASDTKILISIQWGLLNNFIILINARSLYLLYFFHTYFYNHSITSLDFAEFMQPFLDFPLSNINVVNFY